MAFYSKPKTKSQYKISYSETNSLPGTFGNTRRTKEEQNYGIVLRSYTVFGGNKMATNAHKGGAGG